MAITQGDGSIILTTQIDETGLKKSMGTLKGAVSKVGKAFAVTGAVATASFTAIAKSATDSYAEYEQLAGGVETLFKESSDELMAYADKAYETAGLSANDYMSISTNFSASLLQSLGGDTAKATEYANQAIIDMSDNVNKMGTSMEMIQNAYQGFTKQNYTMLDNLKLGYGGTKEEMQRLLDDASKISGIKYDISSFADITKAIHVMQNELGIAGTTVKEASTTIKGSASSMKSAWQNLLTGMADPTQDFNKLLDNFIESVGTFAENLLPVFASSLDGVVRMVEGLLPTIPKLLNKMLPVLSKGLLNLVKGVLKLLPQISETLIEFLPQLINIVIESFPVLIPLLITGIVELLVGLMANLDKILVPIIEALPMIINILIVELLNNVPLILAGLILAIGNIVIALPEIFAPFVSGVANIFVSVWEGIKNIFADVSDWFTGIFAKAVTGIKNAFSGIKNFFADIWNKIKDIFEYTGQAIADAISGAVKGAINKVLSTATKIINGFISAINTAISVINAIPGVSISKLKKLEVPKLAQGAVIPPNKEFLAILGDQKSGTNIEAPLSTIKQAVAEVLAGANMGGNGAETIELVVNLDGAVIYKSIVNRNKQNTIRTGKNALAY